MRIVQVANMYDPRSGGLRTALNPLGAGYVARGHEVMLVVPGPRSAVHDLPSGVRRVTLPAPVIPATGGYRLVDPWRVCRLLERLEPDALEVSDRLTLRGLGRWAQRRGLPSVVISHERLDRLLKEFGMPSGPARRFADRSNAALADGFDTVVCTTGFARAEFDRIGAPNVVQVPLGVDLTTFTPTRRDDELRSRLASTSELLVVHCGRLSPEKHPERSVDTTAAGAGEGVPGDPRDRQRLRPRRGRCRLPVGGRAGRRAANSSAGMPWCAYSLALLDASGPVVGVVADPSRTQIYAAARGRGMRANRVLVRVQDRSGPQGALVCTEWVGAGPWPGMDRFLRCAARSHSGVRELGSPALAVAQVALGHAVATVLDSYDDSAVAGALCLALEAGASVVNRDGQPDALPRAGLLVAVPGALDVVLGWWHEAAHTA